MSLLEFRSELAMAVYGMPDTQKLDMRKVKLRCVCNVGHLGLYKEADKVLRLGKSNEHSSRCYESPWCDPSETLAALTQVAWTLGCMSGLIGHMYACKVLRRVHAIVQTSMRHPRTADIWLLKAIHTSRGSSGTSGFRPLR